MKSDPVVGRRTCLDEFLLLVLLLGITGSTNSLAAPDARAYPPPPDERMAYVQAPQELLATADRLALKAGQSGQVRVIVGVNTPFTPAGRLNASAAAQQRGEIALAQQALLARLQDPLLLNCAVSSTFLLSRWK